MTVLRLHYGKYDMYMLVSLGLIILFIILLYFSDHKSFRFVLVMVGVVEIAISSYLMLDRIGMRSNIYSNLTTKEQRFFLLIMIPKLVNYMLT